MNIQTFIQQIERTGSGSYNITGAPIDGWARRVSERTAEGSLRDAVRNFIRDYGMKLDHPDRFMSVMKNGDTIVLSLNEIVEV